MLKTYLHYSVYLLAAFSVAGSFSGCSRKAPATDSRIVARVGTATLTYDQAKSRIPHIVYQEDSTGAVLRYRNHWVREQLLIQEAERDNFDQQPVFQEKLKDMKGQLLAEMMRTYVLSHADTSKITDQEAQKYYEEHKKQFALNERYVQFRHLIAATLSDAKQARQDLLHGIPWPTVVRKYGIHPDDQLRASEKYWPISLAAHDYPIINRFLHIIGNMEISPIRYINGRYHFVQLTGQKPKGAHPGVSWALDRVKEWLKLQKRRKTLRTFEENLYLRAESNNELTLPTIFPNASTDTTGSANIN